MNPTVGIVVLTWNGKALTLSCLESVVRLSYANLAVIVVDNHSSDGTAEAIRTRYGDRLEIIVNEANLGFSRGNNIGIERALARGVEYVLLLNNDTVVDSALIASLLSVFRDHPRTGVVGPKIYYENPPDQIWYAGGRVSLARGITRHVGIRQKDVGQFDSVREVDYVTGCALMARREVFEKIGYLDPAYRAYFEDVDFCVRAKRAAYEIRYAPRGMVWHKISASTGGQVSWRKISQKFRSSLRFYGRYSAPHHWLVIPFFFIVDGVRIVALVLRGRIRGHPKQSAS